jgi:hypothetical protein
MAVQIKHNKMDVNHDMKVRSSRRVYNATLYTLLLDLTLGLGFITAIRMLLYMCYTFWILATVLIFIWLLMIDSLTLMHPSGTPRDKNRSTFKKIMFYENPI